MSIVVEPKPIDLNTVNLFPDGQHHFVQYSNRLYNE